MREIAVFISHSHHDEPLASALARLLEQGVGLARSEILCTSASEYALEQGAEFDNALRTVAVTATVFIGLVTPSSLKSSYVLFEMGARWGAEKPTLPLLACGSMSTDLPGPLVRLNASTVYDEAHLHQLVYGVAKNLQRQPQAPQTYLREMKEVMQLGARARPEPTPAAHDDDAAHDSLAAMYKLCRETARDQYDIYSKDEAEDTIPPEYFQNARRKDGYVTQGDRIMGLVNNARACQDGLAILESGISWRNVYTQPSERLTWPEVGKLGVSFKRRPKSVSIGDWHIDLSGGDADPAVVATLLENLARIATRETK